MQNQIQVFQNEEFGKVRVIEKDGQPWWVLKDVCVALGLSSTNRVAERLDGDEVSSTHLTDALGRRQKTTIISESGLYAVILRSDKPQARAFRKWITADVIPSIRQRGAYIDPEILEKMQESLEFAEDLLECLAAAHAKNSALMEYTDRLFPKAAYHDAVLQSPQGMPISVIAKDYDMTAQGFNKLLHELGAQYKAGGVWLLYKEHCNKDYTVSKTYQLGDEVTVHTQWTQAGRRFIYDLLAWYGIYPNTETIVEMAA